MQQIFQAIRRASVDTMKEQPSTSHSPGGYHGRSSGEATVGGCSVADVCTTGVQLFEVLYVGKVHVSTKKAPPTFIDEAVSKFLDYEEKKDVQRRRNHSGSSERSLPGNLDNTGVNIKESELAWQRNKLGAGATSSTDSNLSTGSGCDNSTLEGAGMLLLQNQNLGGSQTSGSEDSIPERLSTTEQRLTASNNNEGGGAGVAPVPQGSKVVTTESLQRQVVMGQTTQRNRTMLLQIGYTDVCLISPDRKTTIFDRKFKDISFCSQVGVQMHLHLTYMFM